MDSKRLEYWDGKWKANQSPWHKDSVNNFLIRNFNHINQIKNPARVLVPLCGKSFDMKWIYDSGHHVVGIDGVEEPILQFFLEQGLAYKKETIGKFVCFSTEDERLKIYQADLFSMEPEICGKFDGIWDRGSLVAIYPEDRERYAKLIKSLLNPEFSYLIDTMVYDQTQYPGPPRSVPVSEITGLFSDTCDIEVLETINRNVDPTSSYSPKVRWNVDPCEEVILLLSQRKF